MSCALTTEIFTKYVIGLEKKRRLDQPLSGKPLGRPLFHTAAHNSLGTRTSNNKQKPEEQFKKPAPSTFIKKIATRRHHNDDDEPIQVARSTGFKDRPTNLQPEPTHEDVPNRRNEQLEIIEELQPGPYDHKPPHDDLNFERLEPHSGIHMVLVVSSVTRFSQ